MAITVIDEIEIKNNSTRYVVDVSRVKGAFMPVADDTERDAIPSTNRKAGMVVEYPDGTQYKLGVDLTTWTEKITTGFIESADRGAADGVAPLNASAKIDSSYLPNLFLNAAIGVDDITEMLALTTITGNLLVVADATDDPSVTPGESAVYYKINDDDPATLADFLKLDFGSSVISVNGETGVVTVSITSLLAVEANQTAFDNAVADSPYATTTDAALTSLDNRVDDLETDVTALQGQLNVFKGDYVAATLYEEGDYVIDDTDDGKALFKVIQTNDDQATSNTDYYTKIKEYYTTTVVAESP